MCYVSPFSSLSTYPRWLSSPLSSGWAAPKHKYGPTHHTVDEHLMRRPAAAGSHTPLHVGDTYDLDLQSRSSIHYNWSVGILDQVRVGPLQLHPPANRTRESINVVPRWKRFVSPQYHGRSVCLIQNMLDANFKEDHVRCRPCNNSVMSSLFSTIIAIPRKALFLFFPTPYCSRIKPSYFYIPSFILGFSISK